MIKIECDNCGALECANYDNQPTPEMGAVLTISDQTDPSTTNKFDLCHKCALLAILPLRRVALKVKESDSWAGNQPDEILALMGDPGQPSHGLPLPPQFLERALSDPGGYTYSLNFVVHPDGTMDWGSDSLSAVRR